MSQTVPLANVAAQTLSINLGGQPCQIAVYTLGLDADAHLYFDLSVGITPIVSTRVCRNVQRLLLDVAYLGFQGDFMFIDTQGDTDPVYVKNATETGGLGTRYELLYLPTTELG